MKYRVAWGLGFIVDPSLKPRKMTYEQAERYAAKNIPRDLRRAGFVASVSRIPNWIANPGNENPDFTSHLRINIGH